MTTLVMPSELFSVLTTAFNICWKSHHAKYFEQAQKLCVDDIGYQLAMYWFGKTDRINPMLIPVFGWITETYGKPDERNVADNVQTIIENLFKIYASIVNLPPNKPKTHIFKNVVSFW